MTDDVLYIVVPCYNEEEVLPATNTTLVALLDSLVAARRVSSMSRVLYVDDGSTDSTWAVINELSCGCDRVSGLKLAVNAGHQNALVAGLEASVSRADMIVTIDADLQDCCEVIDEMISHCEQGCDIVYGVRRERKNDSWFKRNSASFFYKAMGKMGAKTISNHADFRLMSNRAVKQLLRYRERNLYLRGIVPLVGYRSAKVYYDRRERSAGRSKYSLGKMMTLAVDGVTSFSIKPVRMVFQLGVIFVVIALCMLVYVLVSYFNHSAVSGWASLILSLWFIGGCILMGLGVVGEYIGKIYIEVKDRPRYNVEQTVNLNDPGKKE